jgi:hypothetical protein
VGEHPLDMLQLLTLGGGVNKIGGMMLMTPSIVPIKSVATTPPAPPPVPQPIASNAAETAPKPAENASPYIFLSWFVLNRAEVCPFFCITVISF